MLDLLVIQPTPFCNIDCQYCYLPDRKNTKKISLQTLEKIIDSIVLDNLISDSISIVWHAGEPLTVNVDYFAEMLELVRRKLGTTSIYHSIQTNGMLINQQWCDLFNKYTIRIGISMDGPKEINDATRTTRSEKGTFDKTMEGLRFLQQNNISYHGIAVITKNSLDHPEAIFDFFKSNGFDYLGLNIEEIEGINKNSSLHSADMDQKIAVFHKRMFDRFMQSDKLMKIREYENSLSAVLRNPQIPDITRHKIQSHQTGALDIISVDCEGNFSTFSPELLGQIHSVYGDFTLGNVNRDRFSDVLKLKKTKQITSDIQKGIARCKKECGFFHLCGGGAPSNKLYENGSFNSTETMFCKYSIQEPLKVIIDYLEKELHLTKT